MTTEQRWIERRSLKCPDCDRPMEKGWVELPGWVIWLCRNNDCELSAFKTRRFTRNDPSDSQEG